MTRARSSLQLVTQIRQRHSRSLADVSTVAHESSLRLRLLSSPHARSSLIAGGFGVHGERVPLDVMHGRRRTHPAPRVFALLESRVGLIDHSRSGFYRDRAGRLEGNRFFGEVDRLVRTRSDTSKGGEFEVTALSTPDGVRAKSADRGNVLLGERETLVCIRKTAARHSWFATQF